MSSKIDSKDYDDCIFKTATEKIHNHTIQLLEKGGKYGYTPYGSGVLIKANGKYLIFTASHVTKEADKKNLYINSPKGFLIVKGDSRETDLEKDKENDLAYIILEDEVGKVLEQGYVFLPISEIIAYHRMTESMLYGVMGYPTKNIRTEGRTVFAGSSFYLLKGAKDKAYEFHKFDKAKSYLLEFAGKGFDLAGSEKTKVDPEPYGISGCGLWKFDVIEHEDKLECTYKLIGIMTQFRKTKYHVLIGNRIEFIMDALVQLEGFALRPRSSLR